MQRHIQDFLKGGAWVVVGMDISYLKYLPGTSKLLCSQLVMFCQFVLNLQLSLNRKKM